MRLTTTTQLSVDGVMEGNGRWALAHSDDESRTFVEQLYQRADAFLFGRGVTLSQVP
jgi:riboflavin biosynthesis pyrimidine reductase